MIRKAWRLQYVTGILDSHLMLIRTNDEFLDFRKYLPGSNDFKKGQVIEGQYAEGFKIRQQVCENVTPKPFSKITQAELNEWARATHPDGITRDEALKIMQLYYRDFASETEVAVIRLRFYFSRHGTVP